MKLKQLIIIVFVLCAASVVSRAAQVDYFLKLTLDDDPGEGESLRELEIPIYGFEWGITNPTSMGSAGGGAGTGKAQFLNLLITKPIDTTSALFFRMCATGEHMKKVVLTVVRKNDGKAGDTLLSATFNMVFVASYQLGGSAGPEGVPVESVGLLYGTVQLGAVQLGTP